MPTDTTTIDTSFTLCDEHTVKKLLKEDPQLLPNYPEEKAVNRGIDLAYGKEQISASVTSGILQGKSIPDIANDLQNRIETMNRNSAIRVARTACTEAENAGRLDSYIEAQGMGIDLQKQWMATSDNRTRPTHAEADGQTVDIDKPFEVGGSELMFPGDPSGSPAEIYNCRCTMVSVLKQEEAQEEAQSEATDRNYDCDLAKGLGRENYDKLHDLLDACEDENYKKLWMKYEDKIAIGSLSNRGTAYESHGAIFINLNRDLQANCYETAFETIFHECSHAIDFWASRGTGMPMMVSSSYGEGSFLKTIKSEIDGLVNQQANIIKQEFKDHAGDWGYLVSKGYVSEGDYTFYQKYGYWIGSEPKYSKSLAYGAVTKEIKDIDLVSRADLSDIAEGATRCRVQAGVGHGSKYWSQQDHLAMEAFAEFSSASVTNPGSLNVLKQYLPGSYEVWQNMVADMAK